ncbi:MAG TPA: hypothetical protein ENK57_12215 [Polyangiaceae bacterium]|nr:hypothetical protein [Polyangiaceae bacterium]
MADDGREIAATALEAGAEFAVKLAAATGDPGAGVAAGVGAGLAGLVAELVRTLGVDNAKKTIEELKRRIETGEGVISVADIEADDRYVDDYIAQIFAERS